jgi:3D (Asp-Asp-Asp) domain-containing protein
LLVALAAVVVVGGASVVVAMWNSHRGPAVDAGTNGADNTGSTSAGAPPAGLPPGASVLAEPPPAPAAPPAAGPAPDGRTAPGVGAEPGSGAPGSTPEGKAKEPTASKSPTGKSGKSPTEKSPTEKSPASKSPAAKSESSRSSSSAPAVSKAAGKQIKVELTGYSFYDNTPAGSAEVSHPIVHKKAGGRGTYSDPITVAVPSESSFEPGTRFYLPSVKRYAIVEDSGASSSDGNHLDLWVDGENGSESAVESCMDRLTGDATAEVNPPPGRPVIASPIFAGSCHLPTG